MSKLKKALEKAKEARGSLLHPNAETFRAPAPTAPWPRADRATEDEHILPVYQRTQIVNVGSDLLRRNRIISVCTEKEADRIKILRTHIVDKLRSAGGNSILVTSAHPREGKTLTAINLSISISQQLDQTVLLVDADLRKPSISDYFGLGPTKGLVDYLIDKAEIPELLVNPGIEKLVILPGGRPVTNSAELLGGPKMKSLIVELKKRYRERIIVFDTSSLLVQTDPLVFASHIDGILLVVESERTTNKDVKHVLELLKNRPVLGMVFNKLRD